MTNKKSSLIKKLCTGFCISLLSFSVLAQDTDKPSDDPVPPPRRTITRPVTLNSPEVLPDNRVVFRLFAPKATEVSVAGEWMTGTPASVSMMKCDTGLWTLTIGPLAPEYYGYKLIIDGVSVLDPNNLQIRRDWLGYESVLLLPGKETELYFTQNVPGGTLSKVWYDSPVYGLRRRMYIYTPPNYEQGMGKYPVLYLLHGGFNDEDTWTSMGRVNVIMDNLIAQGKVKPMIVVMTNGNSDQTAVSFESYPLPSTSDQAENTPLSSMSDGLFEESLVKDVIPFVESNYRVLANKENRSIAGYSMGGGQTFRISLDNPNTFGYIGAFGPAIFPQPPETEEKMEVLGEANPKLYWVGCGIDDQLCYVGTTTILLPLLQKHNINYFYNESTGGHNWPNWRIYFSEYVQTLFK